MIEFNFEIIVEKGMAKQSSGTHIDMSICSVNNIIDNPQECVDKTSHGRLNAFSMV